MQSVLLFAATTGYQVRSFDEAADQAGVRLALATDRCTSLDDPWRDRAIPVRFHDVSASVAAVTRAASKHPFSGVLAVGDRPAVLAAASAEALGLCGHPLTAARAGANKRLARERLRDAGLPVPWFRSVPLASDPRRLDVPLPCVVKPLILSGSRGVIRASSRDDFERAFGRVARLLGSREVRAMRDPDADALLIEEYVAGDEYAVEGVLEHGRLRVLAIFDKPDPLEGPCFEETIYVTPSRAADVRQRAIGTAVARACRAIGLYHGPVHAECRVTAARVVVLEAAARPIGGLCARALRFAGPGGEWTLERLLLEVALGRPTPDWTREAAASGVMMIPVPAAGVFRRVTGVDEARSVSGVEEVQITARPDQRLVPLPEGASYLGFIFARGPTPDVVERALREAHGRLRFTVERPLVVVNA